jgi:hypothetical protein
MRMVMIFIVCIYTIKMGATISKKIIVHNHPISPHNQPIKVDEPHNVKNKVFTWNQRLQLWKDSESRLGRL